jgi:hypothetical protein
MESKEKMTTKENAIRYFQDEPYFEVLVESVARKAAEYTYAKMVHDMTLGAGNKIDCIIRQAVFAKIERMQNVRE